METAVELTVCGAGPRILSFGRCRLSFGASLGSLPVARGTTSGDCEEARPVHHRVARLTSVSTVRRPASDGVARRAYSRRALLAACAATLALIVGCRGNPAPTPVVTPAVTVLPTAASGQPEPDLSARPLTWFTPLPPGRPDLPFADGSTDYFDLFASDAAWSTAAQSVNVFKIYSSWVENQATDAQLRQVVEGTRAHGIALALEIGGLTASAECGSNVEGFDASLNPIRRIEAVGGTVRLVAFDE
ncbi:MAG TPA: hypothetical protein VFW02_02350, partial [Candidatus Limnocylindrales bacterium]|nr:hypothetical protein [Candidatus Limnocylindrales bacterium]